jgi:hypothetical protein
LLAAAYTAAEAAADMNVNIRAIVDNAKAGLRHGEPVNRLELNPQKAKLLNAFHSSDPHLSCLGQVLHFCMPSNPSRDRVLAVLPFDHDQRPRFPQPLIPEHG